MLYTQIRTIYLKSEQTIHYLEITETVLVFILQLVFHPKADFGVNGFPAVWQQSPNNTAVLRVVSYSRKWLL